MSELLPHIGSVADDICLVRSMVGDNNNHPQGLRCINTGKIFPGRPTFGAWVELRPGHAQPEPARVRRAPRSRRLQQRRHDALGKRLAAGPLRRHGDSIPRGGRPQPASLETAAAPRSSGTTSRSLAELNEERRKLYPADTELEARIKSYELAARMQLHAERLLDLSHETPATRRLYGLDNPTTANFGTRCLMARRLVEAGVRYRPGDRPDRRRHDAVGPPQRPHAGTQESLPAGRPAVGRPHQATSNSAACWTARSSGGRASSAACRSRKTARAATTTATPSALLLAGGGFRPGHIHGATDEFGYKSVEKIVNCPSLLATLMHQLGIDHTRLTYPHQGRDETLTDPGRHGRPSRRRTADAPAGRRVVPLARQAASRVARPSFGRCESSGAMPTQSRLRRAQSRRGHGTRRREGFSLGKTRAFRNVGWDKLAKRATAHHCHALGNLQKVGRTSASSVEPRPQSRPCPTLRPPRRPPKKIGHGIARPGRQSSERGGENLSQRRRARRESQDGGR